MRFKVLLLVFLVILIGKSKAQEPNSETHFSEPINPEKFIILPGEQLDVIFLKSKLDQISLRVNSEGKIVDRELGVIELYGLTLTEAKKKLTSRLGELFKNSEIEISVSQPRLTNISIYGAISNPGNYTALNSKRVSDIIKLAGGILPDGSTRNILFKNGSHSTRVDLDRSVYLAETKFDPYLYEGSEIYIPSRSEKVVNVSGEVNKPRSIELADGDKINILIELSGGFRSFADTENVSIIRDNQIIKSQDIKENDVLIVPVKEKFALRDVAVFGEVNSPGYYPFSEGMTLGQLLSKSSGLTSKANDKLLTLFRKSVSDFDGRVSQVSYPISIQNLNLPETENYILTAGDSLFVAKKIGFVKVSGAVKSPGYYPYNENKKISDYIISAGGFLSTADKNLLQLLNRTGNITIEISPESTAPDGAEIIVPKKELAGE